MKTKVLGLLAAALLVGPMAASATPVTYLWSGTFEPGSGPFQDHSFTIGFTVADPTKPNGYIVDASLMINGIGAYQQLVRLDFTSYAYVTTTVGLGGFMDVLQRGDSLYFGICTGGSCNDPVLWNGSAASPVLYTGTFVLGLDSSCTFPGGCNNAIANWFDGTGGAVTTRYEGTLVATAGLVPEPATLSLLGLGLAGVGFMRRRRAS